MFVARPIGIYYLLNLKSLAMQTTQFNTTEEETSQEMKKLSQEIVGRLDGSITVPYREQDRMDEDLKQFISTFFHEEGSCPARQEIYKKLIELNRQYNGKVPYKILKSSIKQKLGSSFLRHLDDICYHLWDFLLDSPEK